MGVLIIRAPLFNSAWQGSWSGVKPETPCALECQQTLAACLCQGLHASTVTFLRRASRFSNPESSGNGRKLKGTFLFAGGTARLHFSDLFWRTRISRQSPHIPNTGNAPNKRNLKANSRRLVQSTDCCTKTSMSTHVVATVSAYPSLTSSCGLACKDHLPGRVPSLMQKLQRELWPHNFSTCRTPPCAVMASLRQQTPSYKRKSSGRQSQLMLAR